MDYQVNWHVKAIEDLKNIDKKSAKSLIEKVKIYLCHNPALLGKPLKGIFKGLYRYRFGDYRIIYSINRKENAILILRIGNRKDIYD